MFCKNCGAKYQPGTNFCGSCGAALGMPIGSTPASDEPLSGQQMSQTSSQAQTAHTQFIPQRAPQSESLAIVSLIMSLMGMFFILPIIGSVLGIIFGMMAKKKIEESNGALTGGGLAQAGVIVGIVGLVLMLMTIIFITFIFLAMGATFFEEMSSMPSAI